MNSGATISSGETQHLGHNGGSPGMTPSGYHQPAQKKSGCGCGCGCFSGCLLILLLLGGLVAFLYFFGFKDDRYIGHIDRVVVWTYEGVVRPKLAEQFTIGMPDAERARFLQMADAAVDKYQTLSPAEKKAMLSEAAVAFWYLQEGSILPPEKIPHLKKFIDELSVDYKSPNPVRSPATPSRSFQEPPRRRIEPPKSSPRLLN